MVIRTVEEAIKVHIWIRVLKVKMSVSKMPVGFAGKTHCRLSRCESIHY